MKILVVNSGSSSVKYKLFELDGERVLTHGEVERIGERDSRLIHHWHDSGGQPQTLQRSLSLNGHSEAFAALADVLRDTGVMQTLSDLSAVGHRVVHGGERFGEPAPIDAAVIAGIRDMCGQAPLHNPANLAGIEFCLALWPDVPQVAVFDTAFHRSIPEYACRYPLPESWYRDQRIRRYGFQGTSHAYVARRAAEHLGRSAADINLVTLHLGSGASAAAIRGGRCVDTSMGFTPLEGLMMGTRSGDIDPSLLAYMARRTGAGLDELEAALNRESGLKGICGDNDMREVERRAADGDADAELALAMYAYRIRKYIGAYIAVLGGIDALVFTAGIGENSSLVRERVCDNLAHLGIRIDADRNRSGSEALFEIQADASPIRILVIATDEELEIARQTADRLRG